MIRVKDEKSQRPINIFGGSNRPMNSQIRVQ